RKRLAGLPPSESARAAYNQGIYTPEFTDRVYDALGTAARPILAEGRGVILDATFSARRERQSLRQLAAELGVEPLFVECRAGREEVLHRLDERERRGSQASDANAEIYLAQIGQFEPLDEIPEAMHFVADSSADAEENVSAIERRVQAMRRRAPAFVRADHEKLPE
ncbi:MAG TPA: ATP-binding protein, partial [Candidatus Binataceae bacterium]|nr:ATP-binding protein [Candidatus Binataceae bacterium]